MSRAKGLPKKVWIGFSNSDSVTPCCAWVRGKGPSVHKRYVQYTRSSLLKPDAERKLEEAIVKAAMSGMSKFSDIFLKTAVQKRAHNWNESVSNACARLELHRRKNRRAGR